MFLSFFPAIIVIGLLLYSCWTDLRSFIIPNWLSFLVLLMYPIQFLIHPQGFPTWQSAGLSFIIIFVSFGLLWYFKSEAFGGGDWKLLSALAPWVGITGLSNFLLCISIAGGVEVILALLIRKYAKNSFLQRSFPMFFEVAGIPYGLAIVCGGLYSILHVII